MKITLASIKTDRLGFSDNFKKFKEVIDSQDSDLCLFSNSPLTGGRVGEYQNTPFLEDDFQNTIKELKNIKKPYLFFDQDKTYTNYNKALLCLDKLPKVLETKEKLNIIMPIIEGTVTKREYIRNWLKVNSFLTKATIILLSPNQSFSSSGNSFLQVASIFIKGEEIFFHADYTFDDFVMTFDLGD